MDKQGKPAKIVTAVLSILLVLVASVLGHLLYTCAKGRAETLAHFRKSEKESSDILARLHSLEKERSGALLRAVVAGAEGLIRVKNYEDAYERLRRALEQAPDNQEIKQLIDSLTGSASFTTTPENASVYLSYINPVTTEITEERWLLGPPPPWERTSRHWRI